MSPARDLVAPCASGSRVLSIYADGACKGNPGEGGAGVVIKDSDGSIVARIKSYLGEVTNNRAEYQALILGLQEAERLGAGEVYVYLDSELVVRQINGMYQVRDPSLKGFVQEVKRRLGRFQRWAVRYIPRDANKEADRLAREAVREKIDVVVAGPG